MIRRLRKLAALSRTDRLLIVEAALTLSAIRIALWLIPVRRVLRPARVQPAVFGPHSVAQLAWAIQAVAPFVPKSTCLVRALATRLLLARRGFPTTLRIGVAKSPDFQAHAWLEHDGRILIGAFEPGTYTVLQSSLMSPDVGSALLGCSQASPDALRPDPDVLSRRVRGCLVLVHLRTGGIYEMNATAALLWESLADGTDLSQVRARMLRDFRVNQAELDASISALLASFRERELIAHAG
jgi:hypothetical protein